MILSFLFSSFASPLTCKEVQEQSQNQPLHVIHRTIQNDPLQDDVVACLQKKDLAHLIPTADADLISPARFFANVQTTKGDFLIEVQRDWSPLGADRFHTLIQKKFFQDLPFFRAIRGFMVQFGLHSQPEVNQSWKEKPIQDDLAVQSNLRGFVSFATAGPNTRTTQLFINTANNQNLDSMGFTPIGTIVDTKESPGMTIVEKIFSGYGEGHPSGRGPSQELLQQQGSGFLKEHYPYLDYIKNIQICSNPTPSSPTDCRSAG